MFAPHRNKLILVERSLRHRGVASPRGDQLSRTKQNPSVGQSGKSSSDPPNGRNLTNVIESCKFFFREVIVVSQTPTLAPAKLKCALISPCRPPLRFAGLPSLVHFLSLHPRVKKLEDFDTLQGGRIYLLPSPFLLS